VKTFIFELHKNPVNMGRTTSENPTLSIRLRSASWVRNSSSRRAGARGHGRVKASKKSSSWLPHAS
jgi:hypothetical protein